MIKPSSPLEAYPTGQQASAGHKRARRVPQVPGKKNMHCYGLLFAFTGISRSTLQRIEQGCDMRTMDSWLRQFARGYGVSEAELLEGQTPKGLFEWRIRMADRSEHLRLLMCSPQERAKLALDFLSDQFPNCLDLRRLATASLLPLSEVEAAIRLWRVSQPDLTTAAMLAEGLHILTGISRQWLLFGSFNTDKARGLAAASRLPRVAVGAQGARPAASVEPGEGPYGRVGPHRRPGN